MAWVATAVTAVGIGASYFSSQQQANAAKKGAQAQTAASSAAIEEQRRQFDKVQEMLSPYADAGNSALYGLMRLSGLGGGFMKSPEEAQQAEINKIEQSPLFQTLVDQGEAAMLQNASATGGLRGGNTQAALAQFRPQMLNQQIQNRMAQLSQLAGLGQASAAGVGAAAQQTGQAVGGYYGDIGAAQAGSQLAQAQANQNLLGDIVGGVSWLGQKRGWF